MASGTVLNYKQQEQEKRCPSISKIIRYLILWGAGVVLITFAIGVSSHILSSGPKWRQRAVQGLTGQNTYCFGKDTLNTYGSLLICPTIAQLVTLVIFCCCECCANKLV